MWDSGKGAFCFLDIYNAKAEGRYLQNGGLTDRSLRLGNMTTMSLKSECRQYLKIFDDDAVLYGCAPTGTSRILEEQLEGNESGTDCDGLAKKSGMIRELEKKRGNRKFQSRWRK